MFKIGFEPEDKKKVYKLWDEIFSSNRWTEGKYVRTFEEKWSEIHNLHSVAFSSWSGAALAAIEYFQLSKKTVLCPSNTFMATPLSVIKTGGIVQFVDCNKEDLCLSYNDLKQKLDQHNPSAVWVVHIGGHIAFQIEQIAKLCKERGIVLLEDCAHAHGASWNKQRPGSWGDVGIYSFYATKTISTGEGGMLVTKHAELARFVREYRNYGKPNFTIRGLNFRMNEFTAALGYVQAERMMDIVVWKNHYAEAKLHPKFPNRVKFPTGMVSGYYKYIVFESIDYSTGKVYDNPCHKIMNTGENLPNTDWVSKYHWCVPIYYKGDNLKKEEK